MHTRLRQVTGSDRQFLFDLRRATMREYVDCTWGWDEAWQRRDFAVRFDPAVQQLILLDDIEVGFLHLVRKSDELFIADMQILPNYQGRGIGTDIIRDILAEAKRSGVSVTLQVLKVNHGARRLYERLGFHVTHEELPHIHMRVRPEVSSAA